MGKKKWQVEGEYSHVVEPAVYKVTREALVDAVEEACRVAESLAPPGDPFPTEALIHIARTTDAVAANTWGIQDIDTEKLICGCPLSQWEGLELVDGWDATPYDSAVSTFASKFDALATEIAGIDDDDYYPMILQVGS